MCQLDNQSVTRMTCLLVDLYKTDYKYRQKGWTYSSLSFTRANTSFCDFLVVELLFYRQLVSAAGLQSYRTLLLSW